ncbi:hypothetical protein [Pontibacter sp. G13]|uniref:hypothetical protein n=1 Tax=Pontibacter sp. G13 TaxID=3074898 RepID=UPI00288AF373|nr:hypothetical protein [Pontibacter sp. G13]WNJ19378.1 hypothetical protein RJD25_02700 [Pontibacter sp. G13]
MLKQSVKEYELLKNEVKSIRDSITRYFGHIIGSNSVAFLIFGFLRRGAKNASAESTHPEGPVSELLQIFENPDFILSIELVYILAIYWVINYRFIAHNQYVGYLQLLSQEIWHSRIKSSSEIFWKKDNDKDNDTSSWSTNFSDIFSWEYIKSRWGNRREPKDFPYAQLKSLDFGLWPSGKREKEYNGYLYEVSGEGKVVNPIKKKDMQLSFVRIIIWGFLNSFTQPFSLSRWRYSKEFKIVSWRYPRHIFIIVSFFFLIQIWFISSRFINLNFNNALFVEFYFTGDTLSFVVKFISVFGGVLIWLFFGYQYFHIRHGKNSIDYYCWAFMPFRVRLLNDYDVSPNYYSTSYNRYLKSLEQAREFVEKSSKMEYKSDKIVLCYEKDLIWYINGVGFYRYHTNWNDVILSDRFKSNVVDYHQVMVLWKNGELNERHYFGIFRSILLKLVNGLRLSHKEKTILYSVLDDREISNYSISFLQKIVMCIAEVWHKYNFHLLIKKNSSISFSWRPKSKPEESSLRSVSITVISS